MKYLCLVLFFMMNGYVFSQTAEEYYEQAKNIKVEIKSDSKQAIDLLTKAIYENPKYKEAYILRAALYDGIANYREEISDLTSLINMDSTNASYYKTRAQAYVMRNDPENAVADYTNAFKKDTSCVECIYQRGKIYNDFFPGKKSQLVMNDFNYCISHGSITLKSLAYLGRGKAYENLANFDKALADYNTAMKINPLNKETYLNRGLLKLTMNQDGCHDLLKYRDMNGDNAQDYLIKYCRQ